MKPIPTRSRRHVRVALSAALLAVLAVIAAPVPAPAASALHLVASGLNQPKKIVLAPNGDLIVALSGDGVSPAGCTDGNEPSCLDHSGAIVRITPSGARRTLASGLPSLSSGTNAGVASGPAQALLARGRLQVLFQDINMNTRTGAEQYGPGASVLGDLTQISGSRRRVEAQFGPFEARHNPDRGAGTYVAYRKESPIDSDPYAFVAYRGGYAVADAGANDVLMVSRSGRISVLAVLPTVRETAPPNTFGSAQPNTIQAQAQSVPDAIVVGPDGALYVGELGGVPYENGKTRVMRIVPGHKPTVYAGGFASIADIAFDRQGRLLVLEIDRKGLTDPALDRNGLPAPGALVRVARNGRRTTLASAGLEFPTGMAVAANGTIYISDYGISTAVGSYHGGEIVRLNPPR